MAIQPAECATCSAVAGVPMASKCGVRVTSGKEAIVLFYHCALVKTNGWLTAEDILTDITAGVNIFAHQLTEYSWLQNKPSVSEKGNRKTAVHSTVTINGTSMHREDDNSDYVFWQAIQDWDQKGTLRVATLNFENMFRDYSEFDVDTTDFNDKSDQLELWEGSLLLSSDISGAAGGWAKKPVKLADLVLGGSAYQEVLSNAATFLT